MQVTTENKKKAREGDKLFLLLNFRLMSHA